MKVTWDDLGRPREAGQYSFQDGTINIRPQEIEVWRKHPEAQFNVVRAVLLNKDVQYALGAYELPED